MRHSLSINMKFNFRKIYIRKLNPYLYNYYLHNYYLYNYYLNSITYLLYMYIRHRMRNIQKMHEENDFRL